jgi:uncharacterized damage-inducible protein DinB
MSFTEALLPEFDREIGHTRGSLERVPADKFSWKPHEKSTPMGRLAMHIALLPTWITETIKKDSLDIAPPGAPPYKMPEVTTTKELLEIFDKGVAEARSCLANTNDARLAKPWSLLMTGRTIFTLPRTVVLRSTVMNHLIHHRAQLGVYLRLNNVPVPAIYGPSADESSM